MNGVVMKEPCPVCKDNPGRAPDGRRACPACGGTKERQVTMPLEKFIERVRDKLRSHDGR